jgi:hypothetical protein
VVAVSYLCLRFSHLNNRYQRLLFFHLNNGSLTWMIAVTTALLLEWSLWLRLFYLNDSHLCLRLSHQWSLCLRFSHEWPLWLRLSYLNDRCDYGALTWMIAVTVALLPEWSLPLLLILSPSHDHRLLMISPERTRHLHSCVVQVHLRGTLHSSPGNLFS